MKIIDAHKLPVHNYLGQQVVFLSDIRKAPELDALPGQLVVAFLATYAEPPTRRLKKNAGRSDESLWREFWTQVMDEFKKQA